MLPVGQLKHMLTVATGETDLREFFSKTTPQFLSSSVTFFIPTLSIKKKKKIPPGEELTPEQVDDLLEEANVQGRGGKNISGRAFS